jgi:hypothetical protein
MIRSIAFAMVLAVAMAGCTGPSSADPVVGATPVVEAMPAPAPPPPTAAPQCDAASLMYLIGKPRTEIPVAVEPAMRRVYCSSCLVTQDYVPGRTDIVFDTQTGIVTQVKCG